MADDEVVHDFAESGFDKRGAYTTCACGWRSAWLATAADAHEALLDHWGGDSKMRSPDDGTRSPRATDR